MSLFKALSWDSLNNISPVAVEKDSFNLVLKSPKVLDSFHVSFLQFPRISYIQLQFAIIKIFLIINWTEADKQNICNFT